MEETISKIEQLIEELRVQLLKLKAGSEPKIEKKYLNIKEAAAFLGYSVGTVYKYTSDGKIPFIKKGCSIRFLKKELMEWMSNN